MALKRGYKQTEVGVIPEEWEAVKLGNVTSCYSGGTPSTTINAYYGGDIPWITSSDLNKGLIYEVDGRITPSGFQNSSAKMVKAGTLLLALYGATSGVVAITEIQAAINQAVLAIIPRDEDTKFLFCELSYLKNRLINTYTQGGQPNLSSEIVKSFIVALPPFPEQRAIAAALSDVDALLASLDALIAKKRLIQQGAMQELLTGRRRLPGFSGEWTVKKLGEIGYRFLNGGTPSTKIKDHWQGTIPWITGADIIDQRVQEPRRFITEDAVKNSATNVVEKGQLLVVTRTGVGKVAIAPYNLAISQDITGVYIDSLKYSSEFLFRYFDFNSDKLRKSNQGTSIEGVTRETLQGLEITIPNIYEQHAIAAIISDMAGEILVLEQQRDKTYQIKQGMMQELLTGKTRLNWD